MFLRFLKWFLFSFLTVLVISHLSISRADAQSTSTRSVNLKRYYQEYLITPFQARTPDETEFLKWIYVEESKNPPLVPYVVTNLAIARDDIGIGYAFLSWRIGDSGGYGLYLQNKATKQWSLLRGSGGAITLPDIRGMGVPKSVAEQIFNEVKRQVEAERLQRP